MHTENESRSDYLVLALHQSPHASVGLEFVTERYEDSACDKVIHEPAFVWGNNDEVFGHFVAGGLYCKRLSSHRFAESHRFCHRFADGLVRGA